MADNRRRPGRQANLLDDAVAELVRLIKDRGADSASGEFGILLTLDRGEHRRIREYAIRTIEPAAN